MSTENTPTTTADVVKALEPPATTVHPITGELLELRELRPDELADAFEAVGDGYDRLEHFKRALVTEVARRADARGGRKARLGGVTFEVNAPTEDLYEPATLRAELEPLVEAGTIDRELVDELIVTPPPKPEPAKVNKTRLNVLKRSDNPELLAALARARRRVPTRRTAKVLERAVEGTATEVDA